MIRVLSVLFVLLLACTCLAADRVVLVEDFTNCGCGYCWNFEPTLNSFVDTYLASGDISVIRVHVGWPSATDPIYTANPTEQNARKSFYGVSGVPTVKVDGVLSGYPNPTSAFNNRINVPSYLEILVARDGDDETGTIEIGLIAEQDLGAHATMRLFTTIVEDDVPGVGYWGGSVFLQAFRDNLFGIVGPVVEFSAPYPDTLYFSVDYDISAWVADNLYLATFVQEYSSTYKEVMNARYDKFMDLQTGIPGTPMLPSQPVLDLMQNPCSGTAVITPMMPEGQTGLLTVYDIAGRSLGQWTLESGLPQTVSLDEPGVYFARLVTSEGLSATQSVVVVR
ncbi:hypothetical protein JW921_07115 [Candidatus Fermentibacterales bacterium]|nr:hypothetical protein [Candidatus Fermentibacterales bacterium]